MVHSQFRQEVPVRSFKVSKSWVREFRDQVAAEDRYAIEYAGGSAVMTPVGRNGHRSRSLQAFGHGVRQSIESRRNWLRAVMQPLVTQAVEAVRQHAATIRASR